MKSNINIIPNSNNNNKNQQNESTFYRIIFVGDSGVGKTQIINIYSNKLFQNEYFPTFGIDFQIKTINNKGKKMNIHCIDTEGTIDFSKDTGELFLKKADSFILVYDITSRLSFNNISQYYEKIKFAINDFEGKYKIIYLVGNKFDLKVNREVNEIEARELGNKYNAKYMEVSAKNGLNIDKLFEYLIQDINRRGEISNIKNRGIIKNNNINRNIMNIRSNDSLGNTNRNGLYNENESGLNYETSSYFLKTNTFMNSTNDYINNIYHYQGNQNNEKLKKSFYYYENKPQKCQIF